MEIKSLLFILVGLISAVSAQDASCMYLNSSIGYTCYLTINNAVGSEISEITGDHLEGFSDADVFMVYSWQGVSTIVPQGIYISSKKFNL